MFCPWQDGEPSRIFICVKTAKTKTKSRINPFELALMHSFCYDDKFLSLCENPKERQGERMGGGAGGLESDEGKKEKKRKNIQSVA